MKIGILTLPLHTNYGGILQAWALQTVLERMGHDVKVINLDRTPIKVGLFENIYLNVYNFLACARHGIFYCPKNINRKKNEDYKKFLTKTQFTKTFVDRYIHSFYVCDYKTDLLNNDFDAIVVGSDQIWNRDYGKAISGSVVNAFLPYLKNKKEIFISYAASFGKDNWEYSDSETRKVKEAIKHFRSISVREESGIKLCKKYLGINSIQHVDPTMLLTMEDYIMKTRLNDIPLSLGNLLVYIIDSSEVKDSIVDYVEDTLSLKRFIVNSKAEDTSNGKVNVEECIQPSVEKWLRGFVDAEFIVTDSFHACVFAILFQKPFIVVGNMKRGLARFHSLLYKFGLENRLVSSLNDVKSIDLWQSVGFDKVCRILKEERIKSLNYLRDNLL